MARRRTRPAERRSERDPRFHTAHFTEFFGALGEVIAAPPEGTVSEASSTKTLDGAFAAAGVGG
jgi:hypothetical protein